jgi:hypothetical protein
MLRARLLRRHQALTRRLETNALAGRKGEERGGGAEVGIQLHPPLAFVIHNHPEGHKQLQLP